jgi:predicted nucleic-acid-binding Zn-ribbon protein
MRHIKPKCPKCSSAKFSLGNIPLGGTNESAAVIYCSKCGAVVSYSNMSLKAIPQPTSGGGVGFAPVHGV